MSSWRRVVCCLVVLVVLAHDLLVPRSCFAQGQPSEAAQEDGALRKRAREYFRAGLAFAERGEVEQAIEAFENAYRTRPHYAVLYNLGQAYAAAGRPLDATRALERFLAEGADSVEPARRSEVEAQLGRERLKLGRLELSVTPDGAEVFVDGVRMGLAPVEPIELEAGSHLLVARFSGYAASVEPFELPAGQALPLNVALPALPPPVSAVTPAPSGQRTDAARARAALPAQPPPREESRTTRGPIILGLGIGGLALASAATAITIWNSGQYDAWQARQQAFHASLANGSSGPGAVDQSAALTSDAVRIQRADDVAFGLALAAGGALISAAVLWITNPSKSKH